MICSFKDRETQNVFSSGISRKLPAEIISRAIRKLDMIHSATRLKDLEYPPSNRLHALSGDRKNQFSISINKQWRICFKFTLENAYDVEICDYHS